MSCFSSNNALKEFNIISSDAEIRTATINVGNSQGENNKLWTVQMNMRSATSTFRTVLEWNTANCNFLPPTSIAEIKGVYGFLQIGDRVVGVTEKRLQMQLERAEDVIRLLLNFDLSDVKCVRNKDLFLQSYLKLNEIDCSTTTPDGWQRFGSMSGYNNESCDDDPNAGCLEGLNGCGCNQKDYSDFLNAWPITSVAKEDWETMKYRRVKLRIVKCDEDTRPTKMEGEVYVFDDCDNKDCPGGEKDCCTKNKNRYVPPECKKQGIQGMLFDTEKTALRNQFGIDNFESCLCEVEYKVMERLTDEQIENIKKQYNLTCDESYCEK